MITHEYSPPTPNREPVILEGEIMPDAPVAPETTMADRTAETADATLRATRARQTVYDVTSDHGRPQNADAFTRHLYTVHAQETPVQTDQEPGPNPASSAARPGILKQLGTDYKRGGFLYAAGMARLRLKGKMRR